MANLTLSIDDELLKRARMRALERDTSVNALVRDYLEDLAGPRTQRDAIDEVLKLAAESRSGSGPGGRKWTREELYER
jgi:plasmid stability protein